MIARCIQAHVVSSTYQRLPNLGWQWRSNKEDQLQIFRLARKSFIGAVDWCAMCSCEVSSSGAFMEISEVEETCVEEEKVGRVSSAHLHDMVRRGWRTSSAKVLLPVPQRAPSRMVEVD